MPDAIRLKMDIGEKKIKKKKNKDLKKFKNGIKNKKFFYFFHWLQTSIIHTHIF
jgi:hypothetical protein